MESEKKIRTFLAIDLPEEIKNEIDKIQKRLKPKVEGVRWTRPEGIHLTLKFFGYLQGEDFANISRAVSQSVNGVKQFTLENRANRRLSRPDKAAGHLDRDFRGIGRDS